MLATTELELAVVPVEKTTVRPFVGPRASEAAESRTDVLGSHGHNPRQTALREIADPATITVTIADSEAPFRAGIRAALEADGFDVVGESDNAATAIAQTAAMQPDICLIDIGVRGDGLNAVAAISRRSPQTTIVVLTSSSDSRDLFASLERGASGYLLRTIGPDELTKSLHATRFGEPALSRAMVPALIRQVRGRPQRRISMPTGTVELTIREWAVAELLRDGLNTVEIGHQLAISPVTVRRHVASLAKKLGTSNRKATVRVLRLFAR